MTNISLPHSGQIRVNLACVLNVNLSSSRGVLTGANMGPSAHIHSLARSRMRGVHRIVNSRCGIRNSLHHRATLGVGHLVRIGSCHNGHRHTNLPIHNRHAGAGTHAHGNPEGTMTNGGGWSSLDGRKGSFNWRHGGRRGGEGRAYEVKHDACPFCFRWRSHCSR